MTFHPAQSLWFLLSTLLSLCAFLFLLRAAADASRLSYTHPFMRALLRWTPPRHLHSARFGERRRAFNPYAWGATVAVVLVQTGLRPLVLGFAEPKGFVLVFEVLVGTLDLTLVFYVFVLVVYVLAGVIVFPPDLASASSALAAPLLAPLRRLFPARQGVDFTPLIAILILLALLVLLPAS